MQVGVSATPAPDDGVDANAGGGDRGRVREVALETLSTLWGLSSGNEKYERKINI